MSFFYHIPWGPVGGVLHVVAFALVSLNCLQLRREPSSTVLWILTAWAFPVLGPLVYLFFGINRVDEKALVKSRHDRILSETRRRRESDDAPLARWYDVRSKAVEGGRTFALPLDTALDKVLPDHPVLGGNRVEALVTGDEALPHMVRAIREARHHIHLQSFIIGNDGVGRELMALLQAKACEGVQVRVLPDRFGSTGAVVGGLFRSTLRHTQAAANKGAPSFQIVGWTQANPLKRQFQVNLRNHRKLLIIDGRDAFCGGVNLSDSNRTTGGRNAIRDYHFRFRGPIVHELQYTFLRDWHFMTGDSPEGLLRSDYFPPEPSDGNALCRLVNSGPGDEYRVISEVVFQALALARQEVIAVTPYFVPTPEIQQAFRAASLRGVNVRLIVPERCNHWFAGQAARAYYEELLCAGVRIYQRGPPFMHSKLLVIDGEFTLLGTANLDVRSLCLNYETNITVSGEAFADRMKELALEELSHSRELLLAEWRRRPQVERLTQNTLALLSPIL